MRNQLPLLRDHGAPVQDQRADRERGGQAQRQQHSRDRHREREEQHERIVGAAAPIQQRREHCAIEKQLAGNRGAHALGRAALHIPARMNPEECVPGERDRHDPEQGNGALDGTEHHGRGGDDGDGRDRDPAQRDEPAQLLAEVTDIAQRIELRGWFLRVASWIDHELVSLRSTVASPRPRHSDREVRATIGL